MSSTTRRYSRRQRDLSKKGPLPQWRSLSQTWRQQYIDLGHCRISRCTRRLFDASDDERDELRSLDISFVALSITAAASTSGKVRTTKECDLMEYIRAVMEYDLPVNDDHHGDSAVELAAYHGLSHALIMLLDEGCPLRKVASQRNAIHAAVRNGQHTALEIILFRRRSEARQVVRGEEMGDGLLFTSLIMEVIAKGDAVSAKLLLANGCASVSDMDAKRIYKCRLHKKIGEIIACTLSIDTRCYALAGKIALVISQDGQRHS